MPPGDPVERELIPIELDMQPTEGEIGMSSEDFIKWHKERGLPLPSRSQLPSDNQEQLIFHNPIFPDDEDFVSSWFMMLSVRHALHEPFPMPKLPLRYEIKPSPNRGLGMFATCHIDAGCAIMYEHPLIMADRIRITPEVMQMIFDRLSPSLQERLMSLTNCKKPEEAGPIAGILRTNAFGVELSSGPSQAPITHAAVLLDMSRCNHSCSPNASYQWNERSYSMQLYSIRHISSGEEIFISYTDSHEPRALRQKRLKLMYDFDCICTGCSLPDARAMAESDARRAITKKYQMDGWPQDAFLSWLWLSEKDTPPAETFFASSIEIAEAHVKEGMQTPFSALETVCAMYAALGDERKYREWGRRAIDCIRVESIQSKSEENAQLLRTYLARVKDPRSIPYWGEKAFLTRKG